MGENGLDVPSASWDLATSVHDKTMCTVGRFGCMTQSFVETVYTSATTTVEVVRTATNYDQYATIPAPCYYDISGCLNPAALNFMCTDVSLSSACTPATPETTPTYHQKELCNFPGSSNAAPPSPSFPPYADEEGSVMFTHTYSAVFSGDVSDYDTDKKDDLLAAYVALMPAGYTTTIKVEPASVKVSFETEIPDSSSAAQDFANTVASTLPDAAAMQANLGDVVGVEVLSDPVGSTTATVLIEPPGDEGMGAGAIVGIVIGILVALMLIGGGVMYMQQKKKKAVFPA